MIHRCMQLLLIKSCADEFSDLCQIEGDPCLIDCVRRKRNAKGDTYWRLEFDVVLRFGLTELQAQIAWFDDHVGTFSLLDRDGN